MTSLRLARAEATAENLNTILRLIREASGWLEGKGTDQWQKPWPDRKQRDARVWRGLQRGATWIVSAGRRPAATVTVAKTPNIAVWQNAECNLDDPAVYAHRLIIDRQFAGWGLGAELIDWTGLRAHPENGAKWIRIDVWSTNKGLHEYYMKQGFEPCGTAPDPGYPSGRLFQKPVSEISEPFCPLFTESEPAALLFGGDTPSHPQVGPVPDGIRPSEGDEPLAFSSRQLLSASLALPGTMTSTPAIASGV
jgi:GNAT superfamily N-acetyltransferase